MSFRLQRFNLSLEPSGTGLDVGDQVNQWLAVRVGVTVLDVTVSWVEGRIRGPGAVINLLYNDVIGARQWAMLFTGTPSNPVRGQIDVFFAGNPGFVPIRVVDLQPPSVTGITRSLVIYQSARDLIRMARPGIYPGYAPCEGNIAPGAYGTFVSVIDAAAAPVTAMNLGNVLWPEGVEGILVRNVGGCPADDCEASPLGGIAPDCGSGGVTPCSSLSFTPDCGCIEGNEGVTSEVTTDTSAAATPAWPG